MKGTSPNGQFRGGVRKRHYVQQVVLSEGKKVEDLFRRLLLPFDLTQCLNPAVLVEGCLTPQVLYFVQEFYVFQEN